MCEKSSFKLNTSSIINIPLHIYDKNFTFQVNGREYLTSQLAALILSPTICKIYSNDPTISEYNITTKHSGDFSHILQLTNFEDNYLSEEEIPYVREIIEILGNKFIEIHDNSIEPSITLDNVFDRLQKHSKNETLYSESIEKEIEYISCHFFKIKEEQEEELMSLPIDMLDEIFGNENLQLDSEDQLISIINKLYLRDSSLDFYDYVHFSNVTSKKMNEFLDIYDFNDLTNKTWKGLVTRLREDYVNIGELNKNHITRYSIREFLYLYQNDFNGIINYLYDKTNGNIEKEISVTSSSNYGNDIALHVTEFNDIDKVFQSGNIPDSWICFDFKEHRIAPSHYTIRSYYHYQKNAHHPKSWVIEASNDNKNWTIIDQQNNCAALNGRYLTQTFNMKIESQIEYRYVRMRQTGPNWHGANYLTIDSIEFYGSLI